MLQDREILQYTKILAISGLGLFLTANFFFHSIFNISLSYNLI